MKSFEEYQGRSSEGLRGFLDEMMLRQEREEDSDDTKGQGVTLITLHAAKGLEFPHVYLAGLEEGILPHDRSKVEGTIDEERRLLYVGITRAMRTLTLTWCGFRIKYGSPMPVHRQLFHQGTRPRVGGAPPRRPDPERARAGANGARPLRSNARAAREGVRP